MYFVLILTIILLTVTIQSSYADVCDAKDLDSMYNDMQKNTIISNNLTGFCDGSFANSILENMCPDETTTIVNLSYNITSGSVEKICVDHYGNLLVIDLDVLDDGYIVVDVPNELFDVGLLSIHSPFHKNSDRSFVGNEDIPNTGISDDSLISDPHLAGRIVSYNHTLTQYKIPFLHDDFALEVGRMVHASNAKPIDESVLEKYSLFSSYTLCDSGLVSLVKYDGSKTVCVKPSTAEKLIERNWAKP